MSDKTYRNTCVCFSPVNLSLSVKFSDPSRDPTNIRGNLFPPLHHHYDQNNECIHHLIHFPIPAIESPQKKSIVYLSTLRVESQRPASGIQEWIGYNRSGRSGYHSLASAHCFPGPEQDPGRMQCPWVHRRQVRGSGCTTRQEARP